MSMTQEQKIDTIISALDAMGRKVERLQKRIQRCEDVDAAIHKCNQRNFDAIGSVLVKNISSNGDNVLTSAQR